MNERTMVGLPYIVMVFSLLAALVIVILFGDRNVETSFFNILVIEIALTLMCMLSFYHDSQRRYEIEKLEERIEKLESER